MTDNARVVGEIEITKLDPAITGLKETLDEISAFMWKNFISSFGQGLDEAGLESFRQYINPEALYPVVSDKEMIFFLGQVQGRLLGILGSCPLRHVALLFVDLSIRKEGLGQRLFLKYLEYLKETDPHTWLVTVKAALPAIGFYHKLGFVESGEVVNECGWKVCPMHYFLM